MYGIEFAKLAQYGLKKLEKSEPGTIKKLTALLKEVQANPTSGTGKPEQLKGYDVPTWSRRITSKHRLIYEIHDDVVVVIVLSTYGHYQDK